MRKFTDRQRLDWLTEQFVAVRKPLRWGSEERFMASPDEEGSPSDLREKIDAALGEQIARERRPSHPKSGGAP